MSSLSYCNPSADVSLKLDNAADIAEYLIPTTTAITGPEEEYAEMTTAITGPEEEYAEISTLQRQKAVATTM